MGINSMIIFLKTYFWCQIYNEPIYCECFRYLNERIDENIEHIFNCIWVILSSMACMDITVCDNGTA